MTKSATRRRRERTPGTPCWVSLMVHELAATRSSTARCSAGSSTRGRSSSARTSGPCSTARRSPGIGQMPPDRHLPRRLDALSGRATTRTRPPNDPRAAAARSASARWTRTTAGRMAIASDPTGAVFGVWQAGRMHCGTGDHRRAGHPGLERAGDRATPSPSASSTRRSSATRRSRGRLRPTSTTDAASDGRPVAGIHGVGSALPRDRGPHWMTYFEVADTDAAIRRVAELGGQRRCSAPGDSAHGTRGDGRGPGGRGVQLIERLATGLVLAVRAARLREGSGPVVTAGWRARRPAGRPGTARPRGRWRAVIRRRW